MVIKVFGKDFVEKNKDNIELNINGNKINFTNKCKLNKGDNNVKMIIKNKIKDFQYMFYNCDKLKDISELKYLNINNCIFFLVLITPLSIEKFTYLTLEFFS